MRTKSIPTRRKFANEWDEIEYLYQKILSWFYPVRDRRKALSFCKRLEKVLPTADHNHEAIFGQECWSLLYEVKGNLPKAIQYRESEIELIKRLWEISRGTLGEEIAFQLYDVSDLSDRYDLLAMLYHKAGNRVKAIGILRESEQLCKEHGIRFDGKALLRDYLAEKKQLASASAPKKRRTSA
jgi:hypothetical protein